MIVLVAQLLLQDRLCYKSMYSYERNCACLAIASLCNTPMCETIRTGAIFFF